MPLRECMVHVPASRSHRLPACTAYLIQWLLDSKCLLFIPRASSLSRACDLVTMRRVSGALDREYCEPRQNAFSERSNGKCSKYGLYYLLRGKISSC